MIVNTVNIATGSKVFLIEEFLPEDIHEKIKKLFNEFTTDSVDWKIPEWAQGRPRYVYQGQSEKYNALKNFVISSSLLTQLEHLLGIKVQNTGIDLWIDFAGFGTLAPHYENEGSVYLAQIYISDKEYPFIGTTIYNDNKEILFQLPFRDNYGWFFDKGYTVMHGREHDIPDDLARCSIMLWFDKI
jgi:hypothetical protein